MIVKNKPKDVTAVDFLREFITSNYDPLNSEFTSFPYVVYPHVAKCIQAYANQQTQHLEYQIKELNNIIQQLIEAFGLELGQNGQPKGSLAFVKLIDRAKELIK